jgi:hypothetical protein
MIEMPTSEWGYTTCGVVRIQPRVPPEGVGGEGCVARWVLNISPGLQSGAVYRK